MRPEVQLSQSQDLVSDAAAEVNLIVFYTKAFCKLRLELNSVYLCFHWKRFASGGGLRSDHCGSCKAERKQTANKKESFCCYITLQLREKFMNKSGAGRIFTYNKNN